LEQGHDTHSTGREARTPAHTHTGQGVKNGVSGAGVLVPSKRVMWRNRWVSAVRASGQRLLHVAQPVEVQVRVCNAGSRQHTDGDKKGGNSQLKTLLRVPGYKHRANKHNAHSMARRHPPAKPPNSSSSSSQP
jgi:hypothetical protein